MTKNNFQLDRKYLYVNTELGCDMVGSNGESYHIPAGYFVFLVDEIKNYFTVSYVDFVYNDFDTSFKVETQDFLINNVQTPFDLNVSSFVQTIGGIHSSLKSIDNYCRVLQNSVSMILNASLQQNPINNVGSLNLVKSSNNPHLFETYVPVMKQTFGGVLVLTDSVTFSSAIFSDKGRYILNEIFFPFINCVYERSDIKYLQYSWASDNKLSRSILLNVISSEGEIYKTAVFGKPTIKQFGVTGGVLRSGNDSWAWALSPSGEFSKRVSLLDSDLLSFNSSFGGFDITGTGKTYDFGKLNSANNKGQGIYDFIIDYTIEIPFTVVPPEKKDFK